MRPLPGSAQERRWAAIDPNSDASSPVAWGSSEAQAQKRAIEACSQVSKTCASAPALTDQAKDIFAVMCCTQPRSGCAVGVAATRQDALKSVQKTFDDAGYSNCKLRHYISAGTGKKL
jgi:hypothetical protein